MGFVFWHCRWCLPPIDGTCSGLVSWIFVGNQDLFRVVVVFAFVIVAVLPWQYVAIAKLGNDACLCFLGFRWQSIFVSCCGCVRMCLCLNVAMAICCASRTEKWCMCVTAVSVLLTLSAQSMPPTNKSKSTSRTKSECTSTRWDWWWWRAYAEKQGHNGKGQGKRIATCIKPECGAFRACQFIWWVENQLPQCWVPKQN